MVDILSKLTPLSGTINVFAMIKNTIYSIKDQEQHRKNTNFQVLAGIGHIFKYFNDG